MQLAEEKKQDVEMVDFYKPVFDLAYAKIRTIFQFAAIIMRSTVPLRMSSGHTMQNTKQIGLWNLIGCQRR